MPKTLTLTLGTRYYGIDTTEVGVLGQQLRLLRYAPAVATPRRATGSRASVRQSTLTTRPPTT